MNIQIPFGNEVQIGEAFFISIFSMIIVFLILLIISYMIDAVAIILHKPKKIKKEDINNFP
ncbi:MAG: OadG family transporter subunit [Eubacteriales bacterium]|nr:OadG family transporter subunit [Eubacteriales bacterium]